MFLNVPQTLVAILGHIWDAAGTSKSAQFVFFTRKMVRRNGFSRLSWTGLLFCAFYARFVAKFGAKIGRKCVTVFIHLRLSFVTLDPHDVSYFTMFYAISTPAAHAAHPVFVIWNLKFEIRSLKFEMRNLKLEISDRNSEIWNLKFRLWDWILNICNPFLWIVNLNL